MFVFLKDGFRFANADQHFQAKLDISSNVKDGNGGNGDVFADRDGQDKDDK